jgi:hypothetical protein
MTTNMMIAFIHSGKAFLPEIGAYSSFFARHGIDSTVIMPGNPLPEQVDVEWHFMGTQIKRLIKNSIIIHEYASASLPPLQFLKDRVKKIVNVKPHFRIFLNEYVKQRLNFGDDIPFGFRDMGINKSLLATAPANNQKEYDFIYCGSVSKDMKMEILLESFASGSLNDKTLLVLSKDYDELSARFTQHKNICFKGPVETSLVPYYISKARFALNYKPVIEPHSHQTSTKFLEYAACNIPIVTTDFPWVRNFQKQYGGAYFFLDKNMNNLSWEKIANFDYAFPALDSWTWEKQIIRSGILEFLLKQFNHKGRTTESLRKES